MAAIIKVLIGKYELRERLGEGADGIVYLAWDKHLERFVAVKEEKRKDGDGKIGQEKRKISRMESGKAEEESKVEENRLKEEMEMLKALKHPMLPAVYDYFTEEDKRYLVMEYIEGESLHNYIKRETCVPEEQACLWAMQLLDLLSYLHTRRTPVIYRDLKPENMIICPDGNIRVVDFGAALSACYDMRPREFLAGTPGYAAPEQLDITAGADRADERSDIYTFGATLYHMLTGYNPALPPFGIRPVRCMNPALTKGIEQIVQRCTQQIPSMRYQTVEEIRHDFYKRKNLHGRKISGKRRRQYVIRKIEKKIWLTEKKTTGLLGIAILLGMMVLGSVFLFAKSSALAQGCAFTELSLSEEFFAPGNEDEMMLPVTLYNKEGQKLLIRYGSAYKPNGNLILELEQELFEKAGMQELSLILTDSATGKRQERVIYIQGTK